jgi:hypothetical protein
VKNKMSDSRGDSLCSEQQSDISFEKGESARCYSKEWKINSELMKRLEDIGINHTFDEETGHAVKTLTDSELDIVIPFLVQLCHALHLYGVCDSK